MDFEVYCDECEPDLLYAEVKSSRYMLIGGLWLRADDRDLFKSELKELREQYEIGGEAKWQKISPRKSDFYLALIDWFWAQDTALRFRCIAVDPTQVEMLASPKADAELAFYKFYYQLVHHWILDFNSYSVFCDFKKNRQQDRLHTLCKYLSQANLTAEVTRVQAIRSRESVLMQLADVLTGAAAAKLNRRIRRGSAKDAVVDRLETRMGRQIAHTPQQEQKFNVFVMNLQGGW